MIRRGLGGVFVERLLCYSGGQEVRHIVSIMRMKTLFAANNHVLPSVFARRIRRKTHNEELISHIGDHLRMPAMVPRQG